MSPSPLIVCYVSGHGFGHAVRVTEVLCAVRRRRPDVRLMIRSPAPAWLFDQVGERIHVPCRLDIGVIQRDSLTLDADASLNAYRTLIARKAELVEAEARALDSCAPTLVFADIPALAFDIAGRLGIPAVGMANFSWDWIYADYVSALPAYADVVTDLRASYGQASLLLRLPMHGDLSAFPRVRDIPLVARWPKLPPAETRRRLSLPEGERVVLLSFGGFGLPLRHASALADVRYVVTQSAGDDSFPHPLARFISNEELAAAGVRYEDLVAASDVVMTKPGYGIVTDCIAGGTRMIYTARGRFAEYDVLVDGIRAHLPSVFISNDDLHAGRWAGAIEAALALPRRPPTVRLDGAEVAAEALLQSRQSAIDGG